MGSVVGKERIPVGVSPPSLPCRSHLGRLGHIGHGGVSLRQLVLNPLKGTEIRVLSRVAVLSVAVPLSPGLEEDRQCADIGLPHCLHKSQDVRDDVAVHIAGTKAWSLTLVLKHNSVPVPVLDPVEAVGCVPVERLPSWGAAFCGGGEASAFSNLANHTVNSIAASGVAVAKEEDFLVGVAVSGSALFWESRILGIISIGSLLDNILYQLTEWGQARVVLSSVSVGQVDSQ